MSATIPPPRHGVRGEVISGFRASNIGQYGIEDLSWWTDPLFGIKFGVGWDNPFSMGVSFDPLRPFEGFNTPTVTIPDIRIQPAVAEALPSNPAVVGVETLPASVVIDPDFRPQATVFEDAPGGIYETNRAPTDWGAVYDAYVILNPPEAAKSEVQEVIDWGSVVGTVVGGLLDTLRFGQATTDFLGLNDPRGILTTPGVTGMPSLGQQGPLKIDPRTGKLVKCRRRRRRRLLTDGDFNDLMRISTLPNKDIVKIALAKAVGR